MIDANKRRNVAAEMETSRRAREAADRAADRRADEEEIEELTSVGAKVPGCDGAGCDICVAMWSASSIGIAPRAMRCERSSPSTSSITRACWPVDFSIA